MKASGISWGWVVVITLGGYFAYKGYQAQQQSQALKEILTNEHILNKFSQLQEESLARRDQRSERADGRATRAVLVSSLALGLSSGLAMRAYG
jgi:predicted negative regulator of RcsB-dependent stress response